MRAALASLLPAAAGRPPSEDAAALAAKVQATYERTRDLEARFAQTYTYSGFGRRQVSSGRVLVKKPGMMRWDYEKPSPKTVARRRPRRRQDGACQSPGATARARVQTRPVHARLDAE